MIIFILATAEPLGLMTLNHSTFAIPFASLLRFHLSPKPIGTPFLWFIFYTRFCIVTFLSIDHRRFNLYSLHTI